MKFKLILTITMTIALTVLFTACGNSSTYTESSSAVYRDTTIYTTTEESTTIVDSTEEPSTEEVATEEPTEHTDTENKMIFLSELVPDFDFCEAGELKLPIEFQPVTDEETLRQKYAIIEKTVFLSDKSGNDIAIKYDTNVFSAYDDIASVEKLAQEMMKTLKEISDEIEFTDVQTYENETGKVVSSFSVTYNNQNITYIVAVIKNYTLLINVSSSENDLSSISSIACDIANSIEEK